MQTYNVLDLFAGIGGLSFGFYNNNLFNVVGANEIHKDIAKGYSLNHPHTPMFVGDIKNLDKDALYALVNNAKIDIVIGGPPCQSYSTIGKRQMDDRANLFMEYKRVLEILKPRMFLFENVTGILTMDNGQLFPKILEEFNSIGYQVQYKVLDAVYYCVPQHRQRVFIVGFRDDQQELMEHFSFPDKICNDNAEPNEYGFFTYPLFTVGDAIGDLQPLKSGEVGTISDLNVKNNFLDFVRTDNTLGIVTEHKASHHSPALIKIMETLKDGEDRFALPENIRPKNGFGNAYAKLWWNKPSPTITRNFACPSSSRCIHPRDSRALTIREGARLQSFPDDYLFYGSDSLKRIEIGNAVPPLLSFALVISISADFAAADKRQFTSIETDGPTTVNFFE